MRQHAAVGVDVGKVEAEAKHEVAEPGAVGVRVAPDAPVAGGVAGALTRAKM